MKGLRQPLFDYMSVANHIEVRRLIGYCSSLLRKLHNVVRHTNVGTVSGISAYLVVIGSNLPRHLPVSWAGMH